MHITKIVHQLLDTTIHKTRIKSLIPAFSAIITSKQLRLTQLGSGEHCALRASLIAEGRSITLYEEVHSKKKEGNSLVHKAFLKTFQSILPKNCRPYIVTDVGFKNPWFKAGQDLGWDYIGRVRGVVHCDDGTGFKIIKTLFEKASYSPKSLGSLTLAKENPLKTNCY